jgi:hypothetical protein
MCQGSPRGNRVGCAPVTTLQNGKLGAPAPMAPCQAQDSVLSRAGLGFRYKSILHLFTAASRRFSGTHGRCGGRHGHARLMITRAQGWSAVAQRITYGRCYIGHALFCATPLAHTALEMKRKLTSAAVRLLVCVPGRRARWL